VYVQDVITKHDKKNEEIRLHEEIMRKTVKSTLLNIYYSPNMGKRLFK